MSMRASWCLLALLGLFVLAAAAVRAQDDADTVMVEVQDFYDSEDSTNMMETESESSSSWAGLSTPPLELASLESSQQSAADFEPQPANDMSPKGDVEEVGTYTASVPEDAEDHALLEANTAVDAAVVAEAQAQLPTPDIDFNKRVEYTVSYELYIPHLRGNWANIFSRGASDGDRTPAMWTYPSGSRIHFRHASTRSWNDGVDSATSGPVGRWFEVKGVVKHNRAWIFVDGNFDNYVDLGPHHHFVWGQKSSLIRTKGQVNPYYDNSMQLRNWQWKNYAEDLPASIPQPNLYGPVRYTVEFDVFVDAPYHGWRNVFLRGAHNGDRTPGVWTWPSSTRLHWRHATTHDWNFDLDPSWAPPFGQWYSFKGVIDHNRAWCYINGMLDRVVDLSHTGQHFTWGSKSLGFLKGPAVHPSYAPTQMRNFKWSNEAEPFPGIKPNFHKTPEFTFSVDIKIPHTRPMHHWPALFVRGNNWGDRSPGLWYMSHNKAIHIRFGSTYTWNTDLDTTTPSPIGRWFNLKVVMDKTKAWVYLDGRLDRFVELPQGHVFRWNGRTLSFARGASIHPGHHNSGNTRIKMRNLKWSNTAEPLPLALPKPNFNGAVDYTMEVDVYVLHLVPNWGCIMNRGRDNGDRTPGIWTWPSSSRIHVRHTSTASSNWDCDSSSAAPVGQWFTLKTIFNHNKCQTYINGRLDRESTLPAGHHFTWGSKSLGWAHGGAVHPSYYDVQTQNLRFTPNTTTEAFVSPLENPNAAFWGAVLRPADQTPPPKAQLFLPPKGVKAPKMAVKKLAPIPPPKRVNPADAKVLAPGEAPKAPKPKKMQPLPKVKKIAPPTKPVIINPMSGKSVSGKAVPPAVVKAPKPAPLITKANLAQMRPELAAAAKKAADALAAKKRAAKAAQDAKDAEARRKRDSTRDSARDAADAARSAEADRLAREAARRAAEKDALAAKLEARRQKLLAEDRAEDSHREARRARKAREHAEEMKLLADIDGKKTPVLPPSGFLGGGAGAKGPKAGANANGGGASLEDNLNGLGMGIQDDGVGESKFVNGFWVGKYAPKHTNAERKLCPDCAPIIYNADSPLSDDDIKLLHKQHADLVLGGVKLHSQDTLDRATLMLDDADALKKKLLDKYPSKNDQ